MEGILTSIRVSSASAGASSKTGPCTDADPRLNNSADRRRTDAGEFRASMDDVGEIPDRHREFGR